jgi:hypothetical protein
MLTIIGRHLAIAAGANAIVTIGPRTVLNGVPVTACHINVQVPADQIATPGEAPVIVSPGGWIRSSAAASLTVQ